VDFNELTAVETYVHATISAYLRSFSQSRRIVNNSVYRVGQIKRVQLTFLLVKSERTYKIERFLVGINYIEQQVTGCQFYLNESVTR